MPPTEEIQTPEVLMVVIKPDGGKAIITETIPDGEGWLVRIGSEVRSWPLGEGYSVE